MLNKSEFEIHNSETYLSAMQTLNKRSRPPSVLRLIMNGFEAYRQARKIGWSRPWNKVDVMTFQSYRIDAGSDVLLIDLARKMLGQSDLPADARAFCDDLLSEAPEQRRDLMGFIFFHEISDAGAVYEGATLSFGRINKKRHRDRLDFILEAPIQDGVPGRVSRYRLFVDPFMGVKPPLWSEERQVEEVSAPAQAFETLSKIYRDWAGIPGRDWSHWTSEYIDYFGPRRHITRNSHFPVLEQEAGRVLSAVGA